MAIIDFTASDIGPLQSRMTGYAVAPGDPRFDEARVAWNLAVDQHPAAVAFPHDTDDVKKIVAFARATGLRVTAQGTGHNAGAHGDLSESILVKTSQLQGASVDPAARIARVEAGALWQDVVPMASEHGLAALVGSSPDVGIVGYSLGGGVGYLGRKHGIAANSVTAIELVTADGEHIRTAAGHEPELFWALRGGGGNFGVVTAMEFKLFPVESLYAGMMLWPWERSAELYKRWRDWTDTTPDEVTSMARMIQFPDMPDVPEPLRNRKMFVFSAAYLGDADEGARVVQGMRELKPEMEMFGPMPPLGLMRLHGDPEGGVPALSDHSLIDALPDSAIDDAVAAAGPGSGSPLTIFEIRQMGGAMGRVPDDAGALEKIDGRFLAFTVGMPMDAESGRAIECAARDAMAALAPHSRGRTYLNFSERVTNTRSAYSVETHQRLQAVKARYDADGLLHGNHRIEAPAA